eukprot:82976-Prorocentrum_lima.AAC.1
MAMDAIAKHAVFWCVCRFGRPTAPINRKIGSVCGGSEMFSCVVASMEARERGVCGCPCFSVRVCI